MSLTSPSTYGEWYWSHGLQSQMDMDEQTEQVLAPYFAGLLGDIPFLSDLPAGIQNFIRMFAEPPSPGVGGALAPAAGEFTAEIIRDLTKPAINMLQRKINRGALETWLSSQQAITLHHRMKIGDEYFRLIMASEGYAPSVADQFATSMLPYPAIGDIMRYARYHDDPTNTRGTVWEKFNVPPDDYDMYEWLTLSVLSTEQIHTLFRREVISGIDADLFLKQVGWRDANVEHVKELGWLIPNPMLMTQGNLQQGVGPEQIIRDIIKADIHPEKAQTYLDAILTKPATGDIIAHELRISPELSGLDDRLTKLGIHPDYLEVYKELAYVIPPISDIITMAVREAFTPDIAARFGQYEDFPDQLEEWAGKKGLSVEWARRYWAAHWSLPSATQGFQMLHRGVIDQTELNMLLRAQDVMPFWRDKLTQIAFKPFTRVDVRRMYKEGVLDEAGVYAAYLDHGYDEARARQMTLFTVKQALTAQAKFSSRDVINAFTKRMIDRSEASSLLTDMGINSGDASYILSRAEYKRKWDLTDSRIAGIKNLYRKGVYDANRARGKLSALNLPSDEVEVLFEQWWFEKEGELAPTFTKAETIRFVKSGKLSRAEARTELDRMGYDEKHVKIYLDFTE